MFSLIITIISIALVAALALATIYYGGASLNKGTVDAQAATVLNEAQQINGAKAVAVADNVTVTTIANLTPGYLSSAPAGWTVVSGYLNKSVSANVCAAINTKLGTTASATQSGLAGCDTTNVAFYTF